MKKAFVFDFDDTLATTDAVIRVRFAWDDMSGYYRDFELTPSEFNMYKLRSGEEFDFSDFRCPELIESGSPTELIDLAKQVYKEKHAVYILTARSSDMSDAIAKFLRVYGVRAKQIICLGDNDDGSLISENKRKALNKIMKSYDKTYFYDDNKKSVELAQSIGVKSYLV